MWHLSAFSILPLGAKSPIVVKVAAVKVGKKKLNHLNGLKRRHQVQLLCGGDNLLVIAIAREWNGTPFLSPQSDISRAKSSSEEKQTQKKEK